MGNKQGKASGVVEEKSVEHRDPELAQKISSLGTEADYGINVAGIKLLPVGCAFYTSSGALESTGISGIIHAAIGSASRDGRGFAPTLNSVSNSVRNSLVLARRRNHKRIAIPFIGGMIFLNRTFCTKDQLARAIVKTVLEHKDGLEVRLIPYGAEDTWLFQQIVEEMQGQCPSAGGGAVQVCPGDITKFNLHGSDVIVNVATTEAKLGGGVSVAIGTASQSQATIDHEAAKIVSAYIDAYVNQHNK